MPATSPPDVVIVRTGLANIASVSAAFERLGVRVETTRDPSVVRACSAVVLPGVGSFGHGMRELHNAGLVEVLIARVRDARPLLAICLGFQLLCCESEESPGVAGLGLIDARVERFPSSVEVPQLGWNTVTADADCRVLPSAPVYFANSYRVGLTSTLRAAGWRVAVCEHGGPFVAGLERGPVVACQFHPELSGLAGSQLLSRWLDAAGFRRETRLVEVATDSKVSAC